MRTPNFVVAIASLVSLVCLSWGNPTVVYAADEPAKKTADGPVNVAAAEQEIQQALAKKVNLEFQDTPLRDAVQFLSDVTGMQILLNNRVLNEAGVASDAPVTLRVKNVSLKSALGLIFDQLEGGELTYVIRHEVLQITTREKAESFVSTKVYSVADLHLSSDELVTLVRSHIAPTTWEDNGGPCAVHSAEGGLVVTQSSANQELILALISDLRQLKQPVVEKPAGN